MQYILYRIFIVVCIWSISSTTQAQNSAADSARIASNNPTSTIESIHIIPEVKTLQQRYNLKLNHQDDTFCKKMIRANNYILGYNLSMGTYLTLAPEQLSKWGKEAKFKWTSIRHQYHESFTKPPVFDKDLWMVNYIGHPYQGGFYFNSVRAQGANFWQSSLFCIGQAVLWEYGWEAGMEQPSVQDLLTTPFLGILVGELSHRATIAMSKNGFKWYEAGLVCIINPSFAINNKLKRKR